jgi:hypothetical protein
LYSPATIANGGAATILQSGGTNTLRATTYFAKGVGGATPSFGSSTVCGNFRGIS